MSLCTAGGIDKAGRGSLNAPLGEQDGIITSKDAALAAKDRQLIAKERVINSHRLSWLAETGGTTSSAGAGAVTAQPASDSMVGMMKLKSKAQPHFAAKSGHHQNTRRDGGGALRARS